MWNAVKQVKKAISPRKKSEKNEKSEAPKNKKAQTEGAENCLEKSGLSRENSKSFAGSSEKEPNVSTEFKKSVSGGVQKSPRPIQLSELTTDFRKDILELSESFQGSDESKRLAIAELVNNEIERGNRCVWSAKDRKAFLKVSNALKKENPKLVVKAWDNFMRSMNNHPQIRDDLERRSAALLDKTPYIGISGSKKIKSISEAGNALGHQGMGALGHNASKPPEISVLSPDFLMRVAKILKNPPDSKNEDAMRSAALELVLDKMNGDEKSVFSKNDANTISDLIKAVQAIEEKFEPDLLWNFLNVMKNRHDVQQALNLDSKNGTHSNSSAPKVSPLLQATIGAGIAPENSKLAPHFYDALANMFYTHDNIPSKNGKYIPWVKGFEYIEKLLKQDKEMNVNPSCWRDVERNEFRAMKTSFEMRRNPEFKQKKWDLAWTRFRNQMLKHPEVEERYKALQKAGYPPKAIQQSGNSHESPKIQGPASYDAHLVNPGSPKKTQSSNLSENLKNALVNLFRGHDWRSEPPEKRYIPGLNGIPFVRKILDDYREGRLGKTAWSGEESLIFEAMKRSLNALEHAPTPENWQKWDATWLEFSAVMREHPQIKPLLSKL